MKNYNLKEGTIDNSVVTIKRLLNAHPEIDTRNLVLGSRFDSNTTSALVTFQKIKGIKPTGTMTRNSWLVLGNDLISYRGTEYLKNASNNDPILLYMLSGVMILKNTKDRPLPSFDVLWSYHKGNDPTYVDPVTKKAPPGFENQCAINMSYALQKGGVNMSSFKGKTVHITENKVKIYLAADIYQLAKWVIDYFQNDLVENELGSLWATNSVWKEENVLKDHSRDSLNYD